MLHSRMSRAFLLLPVAGVLVLSSSLSQAKDNESAKAKGLKIAKICDEAARGYKGEKSSVMMEIASAHGDKLSRKITLNKAELSEDEETSMLIVLSPADVKNTKLLTRGKSENEDDQWLYLPAMKRVKRISSQLKTGSFMGSEFTYEDLGTKDISRYEHLFVREDEVNGRKVWVLEQKPRSESGYLREVVWYDQEYKAPVKIEFFDRKNEPLKVAEFSSYKRFGDRWWRPTKISMKNLQNRKSSVMTWEKRQVGLRLPASSFESENLKE
jgi:hypothetical protein